MTMMAFGKPNMKCWSGFILMALLVCIMTHNVCGHANLESIMQQYERSPTSWYKWSPLMSVLDNTSSMEEDYDKYENENVVIGSKYPIALQKFLIISKLMDNEEAIRENSNNVNEILKEHRVRLKNVKRNISRNNQVPVKAFSIKKNLQSMTPCHFKICNLG